MLPGKFSVTPPSPTGQRAAAELHRAAPGAGERPAVGDGLPAREIDGRPLADVERDPAGIGPALIFTVVPLYRR